MPYDIKVIFSLVQDWVEWSDAHSGYLPLLRYDIAYTEWRQRDNDKYNTVADYLPSDIEVIVSGGLEIARILINSVMRQTFFFMYSVLLGRRRS